MSMGKHSSPVDKTITHADTSDYSAAHYATVVQDAKRKRRRTRLIVLAAIIVVLLLVAAGVSYAASVYVHDIDEIMTEEIDYDVMSEVLVPAEPGEPYYVLLIGSDSREGAEGADSRWSGKAQDGSDGLTDVMILARVDEQNKQVSMLTLPRDTPYEFAEGKWTKLNWAYQIGDGAAGSVQAISDFTDIPISHYVEIHMSGLIDLVDYLGGITVEVPVSFDYREALTSQDVHIEAGTQTLSGAETEVFARERLVYAQGDVTRQSNVRMIIQAIINKILDTPTWELPSVLRECAKCVTTDLTTTQVITMITALGRDFTLYQGTGPTAGGGTDTVTGFTDWYCYVDPEGWERVLQVFTSGEDPSQVSFEGDEVYLAGTDPLQPVETE